MLALADILRKVQTKPLIDILAEVKAEAIVDSLADTLADVEPTTLCENSPIEKRRPLVDAVGTTI